MYIRFKLENIDGTNQIEEITWLNGIYHIKEKNMTLIETTHLNHDYFINCDFENYEALLNQLAEHIRNKVDLVELSGGSVIRVRKGALQTGKLEEKTNYQLLKG